MKNIFKTFVALFLITTASSNIVAAQASDHLLNMPTTHTIPAAVGMATTLLLTRFDYVDNNVTRENMIKNVLVGIMGSGISYALDQNYSMATCCIITPLLVLAIREVPGLPTLLRATN